MNAAAGAAIKIRARLAGRPFRCHTPKRARTIATNDSKSSRPAARVAHPPRGSCHGRYLRSDNGPEFVACTVLRSLEAAQIETALIDPGNLWQNGADESFNGKFRDEYLSLQWFRNRVDAKVGIEQGRHHYNEAHLHSSLGYRTPMEFKAKGGATITGGVRDLRNGRLARYQAGRKESLDLYPVVLRTTVTTTSTDQQFF